MKDSKNYKDLTPLGRAWDKIEVLTVERDALLVQLEVMLDCVDYTSGNCKLNEPVGGVLPKEVIANARAEIKKIKENF